MIIQEEIEKYERFEKNVWNAAIEAAADKVGETLNDCEEIRDIVNEIRKLKR